MTEHQLSSAERLDRAVDRVLGGQPAAVAAAAVGADAALRRLVDVAARLPAALPPPPVGVRFEARLAARLADAGLVQRGVRALRSPSRLLVTGAAVSSAAVGVGVTAYAVWRTSRRHAGGHRLLQR